MNIIIYYASTYYILILNKYLFYLIKSRINYNRFTLRWRIKTTYFLNDTLLHVSAPSFLFSFYMFQVDEEIFVMKVQEIWGNTYAIIIYFSNELLEILVKRCLAC